MSTADSLNDSQEYVVTSEVPVESGLRANNEDVHICGNCKETFSDIELFVQHKISQCSGSYKQITPLSSTVAQLPVHYVVNTSAAVAQLSSVSSPVYGVIINRTSASTEQICDTIQYEGSNVKSILRTRLLGTNSVSQVTIGPSEEIILEPHGGDNREEQSRREFQADEEDVATLLANHLSNEDDNSTHQSHISPSRALLELNRISEDMVAAEQEDTLRVQELQVSGGVDVSVEDEISETVDAVAEKEAHHNPATVSTIITLPPADSEWSGQEKDVKADEGGELSAEVGLVFLPKAGRPKRRHNCAFDNCDFTTLYYKDLVRHMRKHTGERPFQCSICKRSYSRGDKLQVHMRVHSGEKPHRCKLCEYATNDSGSLRKHMRIHSDERPYKCQICPYRSRDSSQLTVHLRTHTGDNPFVCRYENCPSAFKTSSDLKRHIRMHTGEKPFSCELCSYRCAIRSNLRVHVRLNHSDNKPILCSTCDYATSSKREAKEHEKTHADEFLKCGICSYTCINSGNMKNHIMKVHPQEKPLVCKYCSYSCRKQSYMKVHVRKKHTDMKIGKKGKGTFKDSTSVPVSLPSSSPRNCAVIKSAPYSKPFLVKSHSCTICDASFVREDSLRSHIRQHKTKSTISVTSNGAINILSQAAAESNMDDKQEEIGISTDSFIVTVSDDVTKQGKETEQQDQNVNSSNNMCDSVQDHSDSSSSLALATLPTDKEKTPETEEIVLGLSSDLSQFQPVLLYVQNSNVSNLETDENLRSNAEILASLHQSGSILLASHCGQYLASVMTQNSVLEQLPGSLQSSTQYVVSGMLESVVGNGSAFVPTSTELAIPMQSIISMQMDKEELLEEKSG